MEETTTDQPAGKSGRVRISQSIASISGRIGSRSPELRELFEEIAPQANLLLILIMAMPYLQPIPIPVLSTASGAVVALLGLQLMLGFRAWLPERLLKVRLAPRTMRFVVLVSSRVMGFLERHTRQRLTPLVDWLPLRLVAQLVVVVGGVLLMAPPPIWNIMPAWVIALVVIGLM
ncbi:MAG: exopolysaccharide biosynthesis protein, partial [Verrucomicrobiota bacterium]